MPKNYRPKSKIRSKIASVFLTIVLLASIIYLIFGNPAKIEKVTLGAVEYQDFSRSFFINARLEPVHEQIIELPAQAKIKELYIAEGDHVAKNDELLLLDTKVWSDEKSELEDELDNLTKSIDEQSDLSDFMNQADLLSAANLQSDLLNALPYSFQMPDFSNLTDLALADIFADQTNIKGLLTFLDQAVYLTEQAQVFVGQISQMLELVANFEPTQNLIDLLNIMKQQLEFWQNLQSSVEEFLQEIKEKTSESDYYPELKALVDDWIAKSDLNQLTIDNLISEIDKHLKEIEATFSTIPSIPTIPSMPTTPIPSLPAITDPSSTTTEPTQTDGPTDSGQTVSNLTETSQTQSDNTGKAPTTETDSNPIGSLRPDHNFSDLKCLSQYKTGNSGNGVAAELQFINLVPRFLNIFVERKLPVLQPLIRFLSNLTMPNIEQNLQNVLLQSGLQQGLTVSAQLEQRISELDQLITRYAQPITADFSGLISELNVEQDQTIDQAMIALRNYSENELIAVYQANKRDAMVIEVGQKVIYDYEDLELTGEVIYKSPVAKSQSEILSDEMDSMSLRMFSNMSGTENILGTTNTVLIKMSIKGDDLDKVIIGFDIDCELIVEEAEQVLSIPAEALLMDDQQSYVYTIEEEHLVKTPIETGLQGAEYIEIISGLKEDDLVVLNPRVQFTEGQKVKVNE